MKRPLKIVGMGKFVPGHVVTAEELELKLDLRPGWIARRSGVLKRHFVEAQDTCASMGAEALKRALASAQMDYSQLDLIIAASGSYDYPIPDSSCLIQKAMGQEDTGIPGFTLDSTCVSFITALDVASCLMASQRYRNIAVVSSEISSRSLNDKDIETSTLFGDGAAAAILTVPAPEETSAILAAHMQTYAKGAFNTYVKGGGNAFHPRNPEVPREDCSFRMEGPAVLLLAFEKLPAFVAQLFQQVDFSLNEIKLMVPHQASQIALERARQALGLQPEQMAINLPTHGNCIAASIPMALHDAIAAGQLERGDRVLLLGTAAGLTLGGVLLTY